MKVLVDGAMPDRVTRPNAWGIPVSRRTRAGSDEDLLRSAAQDGFRAVVVLGREMASLPAIRALVGEVKIALVLTAADNPLTAAAYLEAHLGRMNTLEPGMLYVLRADGIRPLELGASDQG